MVVGFLNKRTGGHRSYTSHRQTEYEKEHKLCTILSVLYKDYKMQSQQGLWFRELGFICCRNICLRKTLG